MTLIHSGQEASVPSETEASTSAVLTNILSRIDALQQYDVEVAGGCECCGTWAEDCPVADGKWVKVEDLETVLADVAQWIERPASDREVAGSTPAVCATYSTEGAQ